MLVSFVCLTFFCLSVFSGFVTKFYKIDFSTFICTAEVPGECGRVSVEDWTPTFADLVWSAPTWDGGTPILSYLIQFKGQIVDFLFNFLLFLQHFIPHDSFVFIFLAYSYVM